MTQLLPYEQEIAEKINHAAVPDMMDEIWASIDNQLGPDITAPDEGIQKLTFKAGTKIKYLRFTIIIVAVIALIILFLIKTKKGKHEMKKEPVTIPHIEKVKQTDKPIATDTDFIETIKPERKVPVIITTRQASDSNINAVDFKPIPLVVSDSQTTIPPVVLQKNTDSAQFKSLVPTIKPGNKGKGVKDIKDSDYKIVPEKKDSI